MAAKVKVHWLIDKCPKPQDCGKCLEVCPSTVFVLVATDRERYKEPENWVIIPSFELFCTTCNKCIDICPKDAIKIEIKEAE